VRTKSEIHLLATISEPVSNKKSHYSRPNIDIGFEDFKTMLDVVTHRGADVGLHSTGWNREWREFLNTSPNRKEVFDFAKEMVTRYAID